MKTYSIRTSGINEAFGSPGKVITWTIIEADNVVEAIKEITDKNEDIASFKIEAIEIPYRTLWHKFLSTFKLDVPYDTREL